MSTIRNFASAGLVITTALLLMLGNPTQAQNAKAQAKGDSAAKKSEAKAVAVKEEDATKLISWEGAITSMPLGITSFGACVSDGWIYIAGGNTESAHVYTQAGMNHDFLRVNLADRGHWEKLPGSFPMLSLALVEHEGKLYRTGGARVPSGDEGGEPLSVDEFAVFDPATMTWSDLPAMPTQRSSHDACVLDGVLYLAGGWNMREDGREWSDEIWSFDLSKGADGKWMTAPQPFQLRAAGIAASHGKILLTGGITGKGSFSRTAHVFDPKTKVWSEGPELPSAAFGATIATPGGNATLSDMDGQVWQLDANGASWKTLGKLFTPRYFHRVVAASDDEVAFISGSAMGGRPNFIEWMSTDARENETRTAHLVLKNPGPSKNRQGVFNVGGKLYFTGGNNGLEQHDFSPERFESASRALNLVTFETSELADLPVKRQSMVTAMASAEAYMGEKYWSEMSPREKASAQPEPLLIGGFGHNGEKAHAQKSVFHYDVMLERWKELGQLPSGMTQFFACEHDKQLYIFGGMDFDPARGEKGQFLIQDQVLKASLGGDELSFEVADFKLPRPRRAFAATKMDNKVYLIGGMAAGFSAVAVCDVYDFESNTWSIIPSPMNTRISADLIPYNGKLYYMGGSHLEGTSAVPEIVMEVYEPEAKRWRELDDILPIEPNHMRAMPWGNAIMLVSTQCEEDELHIVLMQPE